MSRSEAEAGSLAGGGVRAFAWPTPEQVMTLAMGALVWLGVVLRSRGVWFGKTISLWEDEAAWAIGLVEKSVSEHVIRAPAFMLFSKSIVTVFGASEAALRFMPWLAGVLVVCLAPLFARDVLRSPAARLLFVAVLALHPGAIDLGKEFKPYSIALLLHFILLWVSLRYARDGAPRDLLIAAGTALLGVLFSHDLVLAFPGTFGLIAWLAYRNARFHHLGYAAASGVACVALLCVMYVRSAPQLGDMDQAARYWGAKYDVFFVGSGASGQSRLGWIASRVYDMSAVGGLRRELWDGTQASLAALQRADKLLWSLSALVGVVTLILQRRWEIALLIGALLTTLLGFNYFGYWPLGVFRTNLFVLVYVALLSAVALDARSSSAKLALLPACVLVLLPYLLFGRTNHSRKQTFTAHGAFTTATNELVRLQGDASRSALALDGRACHPWKYYTRYHPDRERAALLTSRFDARCIKSKQAIFRFLRSAVRKPRGRAFVLFAGEKRMGLLASLPKDLRVLNQERIGRSDALVARLARKR